MTSKRHFGCNLVMRNLSTGLAAQGLQTTFAWPVGVDWRKFRQELPEPGTIDAIVVNGEGSIHHSATRPSSDALVAVAALAKTTYKVPIFLVNATLFGNASSLYQDAAHFDQIFVRDQISLQECSANGISATVCPDATLAHAYPVSDLERHSVGTTDSCFRGLSRAMKAKARTHGYDFVPMENGALHKMLRRFMSEKAAFRDPRFESAEIERYIRYEPDFFLSWLSRKKAVVTGRYHAVTMSILTETPVVALQSNTPKISSFLESVFGNTNRLKGTIDEALAFAHSAHAPYSNAELDLIRQFRADASNAFQKMTHSIAAQIFEPKPRLSEFIGCTDAV